VKFNVLTGIYVFCFAVLSMASSVSSGQAVNSDSWAATDALGRKLRSYEEAGAKRADRYVAMFYWTWHIYDLPPGSKVNNTTEILRNFPEALKSFDHPAWSNPGRYYWEQPLFGYYKTTDPWVLRKHAEMLADAGVDVVFFDCSNLTLTWKESYEVLMQVWTQAQIDGVNVPRVAFLLPFGSPEYGGPQLRMLYNDIYKPGRYRNLWFIWKGKPCIMARPEDLTDSREDREIADFFTFRPGQPDYVDGPKRHDNWGWLEVYPQHGYVPLEGGGFEQTVVGVSQNTNLASGEHFCAFNEPETYGRSFSKLKGFDPRADGYLYGWNFQEQWDRAMEIDPELVFVTGWNEYIAGRVANWPPNKPYYMAFPDEFDWNRSRDIEPNKGWGDRGDVYYMQLIDNVRRFKGMEPSEKASGSKTIIIGKADGWDDVEPFYKHYKGNTMHRNHKGYGGDYYINNSGRNDIVGAKVAHDAEKMYFYVETAEKLTPSTDRNWMMLFLDTDRNKATGWNGYDFIVNRLSPKNKKVIVEKNTGGRWEWETIGESGFAVSNNKLEIEILKKMLQLTGSDIDIEFKWNDNMQENGNIMDFYVNGDTAPGGRFNFVFSTSQSAAKQ
jgi:hypothetical protein